MSEESRVPLRPDNDPDVLAEQLSQALRDLPAGGDRYQSYLAQTVRACFLAVQDGDLGSPQASLAMLGPALHLGERLIGSDEAIEAAAWLRATARFFEVAKEALAPRLTLDTFIARERSETETEILDILLRADSDKVALRRGEIAARWSAAHPKPTDVRIGQILANLHEHGLVVRIKQPARGGSDVAFYRLGRLGRELCERLALRATAPEGLVVKDEFYARLEQALHRATAEPLYLTTFDDLDGHGSAQAFHRRFLGQLSEIRRPIHWIFAQSTFFKDEFQPTAVAAGNAVHLYVRDRISEREPTTQVLDGDSFIYPVAPKLALSTKRSTGLETWNRHRETARVA